MNINFNDIIDAINSGKIKKVIELRDSLSSIIDDFKNKTTIQVHILNKKGNITEKIKEKFPKFKCFWSSGDVQGSIGTNVVYIPSDMWNDQVKEEISKFDDFVGHQVEKHQAYQLKKNIEIPFYLENDIKYYASLKNYNNIYDFKINSWDLKNTFRVSDNEKLKYFDEVTVIDKEWDNQLWVYDDRVYSEHAIERFKNYTIEL